MRIAIVVTGGVDRSGRERVVPSLLWLIERLARRHDVHVFALHHYRDPCTYPLLGAIVHDVGRVAGPTGLRRFRLRTRLAAAIGAPASRGRFDVLHAYCGMPAGVVSTHVGRRLGMPVLVSLDSGELVAHAEIRYGLQRRWIDRRAMARTIRDAVRITAATDFMARMAPLAGARVDIIPLGIDARRFPDATRGNRHDGPPWRLLRVASLNAVKDYPTLLQALARLLQGGLDVHLDSVGEDTLGGAVQVQARTLGVERQVTFHGFRPTDALAAFYARAHLHVVSSRHEAASVAVLEAASSGLATVGTAVGYVADWTPDRAVAVSVGDSAALADAIAGLLQDPSRRERIAAAARAWTIAHDADWTARQFERVYGEVAGAV